MAIPPLGVVVAIYTILPPLDGERSQFAGSRWARCASRFRRLPAGRLTVTFGSGVVSPAEQIRSRRCFRSGDPDRTGPRNRYRLHLPCMRGQVCIAWLSTGEPERYRRTRKVSANQKGIGDQESDRRPRKRPATKKPIGDQEAYRRPRSLSAIKKPIGDQEAYRRRTSATEDLNTY
jgi:hypothetical protein